MSETGKIVVGCYLQLDKQPRQNGKTLPCTRLMEENDRLCELVEKMARALGVGSDWCNRECGEEFGCTGDENGVTGSCAIVDAMEELGWPVVEEDE